MTQPLLSIVLPCYNEAESLPALFAKFSDFQGKFPGLFELILVNNGSTDNTAFVLQQALQGSQYSFAKAVRVEKNQGYGYGLMAGLKEASGDFLAFTHADLQTPPEDVFLAFEKLKQSPNPQKTLVKGQRKNRGLQAQVITLGMGLLATLVFQKKLFDINGQPKVFPKALLEKLQGFPKEFQFDLFLLVQAKRNGYQIETIPVYFQKRKFGQSKWAFSLFSKYKTILKTVAYMFHLKLKPERGLTPLRLLRGQTPQQSY